MKHSHKLGLFDVFCTATGAMISSGLFILPGLAHAEAGPAVVLSYLLGGLLAMTGMLSQSELVSAMPKTGGTYYYVTRSMGAAMGTVDGLITWFSVSLKSAFALVGMAAFMGALAQAIDIRIVALLLCVFFVGLNIFGIEGAALVQRWLVVGLLAILGIYIVRGMPAIDVANFEPFAPHGLMPVLSTAGLVFISFGGLVKVAAIAEEVKQPARTVPLGMMLSLGVVSLLYFLVVFVTSGTLGGEKLDASLTPISDGARVFLGTPGVVLLSIAAILAFISTANAGIMAASRYPVALSRDRLLPTVFATINSRFHTPHVSLIFTGGFMVIALFLKLSILVKVASSVLILTFLFSCLSVIIMRESRLQNYRPQFRSPLYPWVQIIGIVGCLLLLVGMGTPALLASAVLVAAGFFSYWFYGRVRSTREYALLHLIERLTSKDLTEHLLESELKEVIRERDHISTDRFDHFIEECPILDIDRHMTLGEFFGEVAETLSPRLNTPKDEIVRLLHEREEDTSTVIASGLAIPHLVLQGEHQFDILLARCKPGIAWSGDIPEVHAVFVLAGTKDERNFHLRALAAIAQIAQPLHFYKRWIQARNKEALRDVVLLGQRQRL
ncbi:MAG: amino acid permease [Kiritimatiellia bacterium]|nr:amino acid permease [Kiritimatiellia bacterium]MDP6630096.1 amino acid permease [Kiritimatiellia bacterium]MDP6811255.1 amino acid permease [Kiritimatiellia bacterium]MDP7024572.1 amino acid permease [Kiritimatiellia bacterium]